MPADPALWLIAAVTGLAALVIASHAALRGWAGWLDLRRLELEHARSAAIAGGGTGAGSAGSRIELADLKERIRKLEAIAAGVDL